MAVCKFPGPFSLCQAVAFERSGNGSCKQIASIILTRLLSLDREDIPVPYTNMRLHAQTRRRLFGDKTIVIQLLKGGLDEVKHKDRRASVGNIYWYPAQAVQQQPRFNIASAAFGDELLWEDVVHIIETLITYYKNARDRDIGGMDFLIGDSERGGLGSGAVIAKVDDSNGDTALS